MRAQLRSEKIEMGVSRDDRPLTQKRKNAKGQRCQRNVLSDLVEDEEL